MAGAGDRQVRFRAVPGRRDAVHDGASAAQRRPEHQGSRREPEAALHALAHDARCACQPGRRLRCVRVRACVCACARIIQTSPEVRRGRLTRCWAEGCACAHTPTHTSTPTQAHEHARARTHAQSTHKRTHVRPLRSTLAATDRTWTNIKQVTFHLHGPAADARSPSPQRQAANRE